MNKKTLNEFMKKIDKKKYPKHWNKFINENVSNHNLILKYGKRAFCTHCQAFFYKNVNV